MSSIDEYMGRAAVAKGVAADRINVFLSLLYDHISQLYNIIIST